MNTPAEICERLSSIALWKTGENPLLAAAALIEQQARQQEFIGAFGEALHQGRISQIIYVPTEANIPIMEAGHRGLPATEPKK